MTEKEYKDVDNKMLKAAELRKAVHDTKDRVEWFEHETMGAIKKDGFFLISTWSGCGNAHVPYNESTKPLLDVVHDMLIEEAEKAKKEWEEYKI